MTDRKLGEDVMGVFELGLGLIDKSVFNSLLESNYL